MKRLASASAPGAWSQAYTYDGFGNLTAKTGRNPQSLAVDSNTNRLLIQQGSGGFCYDKFGNMTADNGTCQAIYNYDVANRMTDSGAGHGSTPYLYNAGNQRVAIIGQNGVDETIFFYGQKGEKLATIRPNHNSISTVVENVYFAGQLWLQGMAPQVGTNLLKVDRLGSVRGAYFGNSIPSATYLPFGEELSVTSNDREKFGTYTRDDSNGFDYANQRYYSSAYGRFTTADPSGLNQDIEDPGSWNSYSYVEGDPINLYDPDGTAVSLPPIISSSQPTCLTGFLKDVVGSGFQGANAVNSFLNTDQGILGLTTWLEWRQYGSQADINIWKGIAGTFVDIYNLPEYLKQAYRFNTGSLAQVVEQGSNIWNGGNILPQSTTDTLVRIFNGPPASVTGDGRDCNGLIQAFKASLAVLANPAANPFKGSLFFSSGSAVPSTFYQKQLIGSQNAEGTLWRFWKISNPPKAPPSKPRPVPGPQPL